VKTLWGSLSDDNTAINNKTGSFKTLNGNTYIEVGTGIDNIFKVFRLDFIWRLASSASYAVTGSKFVFFGNFQFQV